MVDFYKIRVKRKLEERSHLRFDFPRPPSGRYMRIYVPMLENCRIRETGESRLVDYNLLNRAGSLFAYTGAKSREFTLTFKISLHNLIEVETREGLNDKFRRDIMSFIYGEEMAKNAFFTLSNSNISSLAKSLESSAKKATEVIDHASLHREFFSRISNPVGNELDFFSNFIQNTFGNPDPNGQFSYLNKTINLIIQWINIIRASVLNNSTDTTLGPPIVRITHGPMYNNVPCVVDNFDISVIEEAGYEVQTLFPKQIEISMKLKEFRTSSDNSYKVFDEVSGDTHVGWEALIDNSTLDPYNGVVR